MYLTLTYHIGRSSVRLNMQLWLLLLAVGSLGLISCTGFDNETALNADDFAKYEDCDDILKRGQYQQPGPYLVYLNSSEPITVYCDFDVNTGRLVIMQQKYGRVSFRMPYVHYTSSFGSLSGGDFWVGLHNMWSCSMNGYTVLTLTMQDWSNQIKRVRYNHFSVGNANSMYRLSIGGYDSANSDLPDDLYHNNGMPFATFDKPDTHNCAQNQGGDRRGLYKGITYYKGGNLRGRDGVRVGGSRLSF
ncbi:MFAP4-like protein [Mya arenaria]|uniref:MFAP4-like protein n=1 Tax=Mya arenaria TaxID=6604 RepID=A0ABY7FZ81_MYAAR|nr:MFAP4-like protein [Mya arenaria]